jgi:predicted enzyme related to lactoylglutathione lyase
MSLWIDTLTIDCHDPQLVADFWCLALDYRLVDIDDHDAEIAPNEGPGLTMLFQHVPEGKEVKNRLHLDIRASGSMDEEVERIEAIGGATIRRVDEGGSFWTVMADPEGNEFCILRGPADGWSPEGS